MKLLYATILIMTFSLLGFGQLTRPEPLKNYDIPFKQNRKAEIEALLKSVNKEFDEAKLVMLGKGFEAAKEHFQNAQNLIAESKYVDDPKVNDLYLKINAFVALNEPKQVSLPDVTDNKEELAKEKFEAAFMGTKPKQSPRGSSPLVIAWLNKNLNDPYSMRILSWGKVQKIYKNNLPYWYLTLRLRAKNAFNAYVLEEYDFYIKQNKIVGFTAQ